jgi:hypothetical protein
MMDKLEHGTMLNGEKNSQAKLTAREVIEIRGSSEIQAVLARRYGVCQATIAAIIRRKTWKHI